ncbi:tRNA:m(4)X modification enzyme TRM13 homolog isoform X2 [Cephus cinctus]|nr:tRNA:m(4)X modification enzyme TRM13 homolog isoform X2 [Cephus cinctus]
MQPSYIVKGINLDVNCKNPVHVPLPQLDQSILETVLNKINIAYKKLPTFPEAILTHEILEDELNNTTYGKTVRKHLLQNASLLKHLERVNLIRENTCFIEFGAGKGKLTYWLAQMIKKDSSSSIVLVDRSSHRHKSDNKLKNEDCSLGVVRIRADIADLRLSSVPEIKEFNYKVGIAKHLCGAATDLTIRCLVNSVQDKIKTHVAGLIIAFCCHHRCEYASYVGKQYLAKCGFTADEFPILCSVASWATCGTGLSKETRVKNSKEESKNTNLTKSSAAIQDREATGRKVKTLLNWGRVEYLQDAGFDCQLLYYTTFDVSLENMCIIAKKHNVH